MRTDSRRSFLILLAAALLLGQAAGLQHEHARSAECPPGACVQHAASHEAPGASLGNAEGCGLCDLAAQGRTTSPGQATRSVEAPRSDLRPRAGAPTMARTSVCRSGTGPRAPPASA